MSAFTDRIHRRRCGHGLVRVALHEFGRFRVSCQYCGTVFDGPGSGYRTGRRYSGTWHRPPAWAQRAISAFNRQCLLDPSKPPIMAGTFRFVRGEGYRLLGPPAPAELAGSGRDGRGAP